MKIRSKTIFFENQKLVWAILKQNSAFCQHSQQFRNDQEKFVKTQGDTKIHEKSIETMKTGDITADFCNLSMSKMSTPRSGLRPKKMTKFDGNKILQPMLMKAAQRRAEVITLDDSMEEKKAKTKSNDVSIEFIRVIDRKAEKRRKQVEEITKKKRKSLEQIPKDVKTLTKVARRVKRGQRVGEPKRQQTNEGFRFNPTSKPALNFGRQVPLSLRAKRPIGNILVSVIFI